jgi:hypothetical protein
MRRWGGQEIERMRTVKKNAGCTVGGRGDLAEEGLQKAPFFSEDLWGSDGFVG